MDRKLLKTLEGQGCTVTKTRGSHWLVVAPGGGRVVLSSTPSDSRARRNAVGQLRRAGVKV